MTRKNSVFRWASLLALLVITPNATAWGESQVAVSNDLREGRVKSVGSEANPGTTLPKQTDTLTSNNAARLKTTDAAKVEASALRKVAKDLQSLQLGVYRTQNLSEGRVPAPGLADFAAYVRAAPAVDAKVQPGETKSAPKVLVEPGSLTTDELRRQQAAESLRLKTVESIQKILNTRPDPEKKLALLMRLAEIQVERGSFALELEIAQFNALTENCKEDPKCKAPIFQTKTSKELLISATQALRQVVNGYPNHQRSAEATFNLGFLLTQIESDTAELYFKKLIKLYPKSEYVPAAWLALGEYYFSRNRFAEAMTSYRKVLKYKGSSPYFYAVYKLAWAYFNQRPESEGDQRNFMNKSLAAFKLVVKLADSEKTNGVLAGLKDQALRDLVLVYAELRDVQGAQTYFETLKEPELYVKLLERLAWRHADAGEYGPAIGIYQKILKENPLHGRVPEFYSKIPELYEKWGQRKKAIATMVQMSGVLAKDSPWMKQHASNADAIQARTDMLKKEIPTWGKRYHAEAQKTNKAETYREALEVYTIYLAHFGDEAESYDVHHFRGDILVRENQFLAAANEYTAAVALDKKHNLKGKYSLDAALNAITCFEKAIAGSPAPDLPKAGQVVERIALPTLYQRLVDSIDTYESFFPTHQLVRTLAHRAANVLYAFGNYEDSERRWTGMAQKWIDSPEVREGLLLTLKVQVNRKSWDTAVATSRKFLALGGIDKTKVGGELVAVLKASMFSKAIELEKAEKHDAAADTFLAYHHEFQGDNDAPKALFNAANNRFKVGRVDDAISALRTLLAQYPKSDLMPESYYLIANAFDALGQFSNSAETYEQLGMKLPKDSKSSLSVLRAAEQRLATGEHDKALANAEFFLSTWPKHEAVTDVLLIQAESLRRTGKHLKAVDAYRKASQALARTKPTLSVMYMAKAAQTAADGNFMSQATEAATLGMRMINALPATDKGGEILEAARMLGMVQLRAVDERLPAFLKKKINDGQKVVEDFTKLRNEANSLSEQYVDIVKLGSAEAGVAAMFRAAQIQEHLANTLLQTPPPTGAQPTEIEAFRGNLEKVALPLQEESTNLFLAAWEQAKESEALTPYIKLLREKLSTLRPAEFRDVAEEMPKPLYYSSQIVRSPETRNVTPN